MTNKLAYIQSSSLNPYYNLALEEYLLDTLPLKTCLLYLWQNDKTVVIGRNQKADNECNINLLNKDGGYLARRLSGGGAVYHDIGNLNYTFITNNENFDINKQTRVILKAILLLGLKAKINGRNDLTINDKKFSGQAYYHGKTNSLQHGTIMLEVDNEKLASYLQVSLLKLQDKHVKSVKSRVINLKQLKPDITVTMVKDSLKRAFAEEYNLKVEEYEKISKEAIKELEDKYSNKQWLFGNDKKYNRSIEKRFPWGMIRIEYDLNDNIIDDCVIYSDGLEVDILAMIPDLLKNMKITDNPESIINKLQGKEKTIFLDIFNLIKENKKEKL